MQKRRTLVIALAVVAIACLATAFLEPTGILPGILFGENFFRGRPSSYWRKRLQKEGNPRGVPDELARTFADPDAIPVLVDCLGDVDSRVRLLSAKLLLLEEPFPEAGALFCKALGDPDSDVQLVAIVALKKLGHEATGAVPQLVALSHSDDSALQLAAHEALWSVSPQVAKKTGWREFNSEEWEFKAFLPPPIESEKKKIQTPYGEAPLASFAGSIGPVRFTIAVAEYDPQVNRDFSEEDRYDSAAQMTAGLLGGKLVSHTVINQGGLTGREQIIEVPDTGTLLTHVFLVGNRSYQAQVAFPSHHSLDPKMEQYFLDSFAIRFSPTAKMKANEELIHPVASLGQPD